MIKKQKTISLLLLVVLISLPLFFLSACGPTGNGDVAEEGDSQENGETFELKFATVVNSPHAWVDTANYFAEEVEKRTNGKVKTVVYPGGQLGDDETSADELRMGTVDLMIGGTSNITSFVPELQIFNLTYLFDNLEHQRHSIRFGGPLEKKYKEIFDEKGIGLKLLNLTVGGTRHFFNNKKPVVDPEDIKGIKMRTSGS
ncbi:MAG: TRAP transporter substrate-binding protein, partial [Firmicutes bacterium]|nr:TRAP transporter substrate-binding protein [Bacillota bacterium]